MTREVADAALGGTASGHQTLGFDHLALVAGTVDKAGNEVGGGGHWGLPSVRLIACSMDHKSNIMSDLSRQFQTLCLKSNLGCFLVSIPQLFWNIKGMNIINKKG